MNGTQNAERVVGPGKWKAWKVKSPQVCHGVGVILRYITPLLFDTAWWHYTHTKNNIINTHGALSTQCYTHDGACDDGT